MSPTPPAGTSTDDSTRPHPSVLQGLGRTGFAVVAIVALVMSMNLTAKYLVTVSLAEWFAWYLHYFLGHSFIGVVILLGAVWARSRFPRQGVAQYAVVFLAVTVAATAALIALPFLEGWVTSVEHGLEDFDWFHVATEVLRYGCLGAVIAGAWLYLRTEAEHRTAIEQCAIDAARMDQQTAEARLQMLEAQIEPHFLFNTLAHVRRLYETDRAGGARMLRNLKDYLAVALPQMRMAESTLGTELDHVRAYLDIQQIRMEQRLAFGFDVPEALRSNPMPALMLLTLVENAVKHGLSPQPGGGRIDVRAAVEGGRLRVEVSDTGRGFAKSGGAGTGLANIRARLESRFGADASLALAVNAPRGVVATITLPWRDAAAPRSARR